MAVVVEIKKHDGGASIKKKIDKISSVSERKFPAAKFTGKIKSLGDGLAFQKKLRNEWQ